MLSEKVIEQLMDFVATTGRLPDPTRRSDTEVVNKAIKAFGSLQNALRMAGLLNLEETTEKQSKIQKKEQSGQNNHKPFSKYPPEFFLNYLGLSRATGDWWERKANSSYKCSKCRRSIEKGERYIGRKILHPGMRGPYGYRGTYETNYFHIPCLLTQAKAQTQNTLNQTQNEISNMHQQISDLQAQIIVNTNHVKNQENRIIVACKNYDKSRGQFRLVSKWFSMKFTEWSANREIQRMLQSTERIKGIEIPFRNNRIIELTRNKDRCIQSISDISNKIAELS